MPERTAASSATLLAFDFGTRRIGVAVGESGLGLARPLSTIDSATNEVRFAAITRLIGEWQPARLLVGLPLHADGKAHEMSARCRRFANQLSGRYGLPVDLVDERLTSAEAEAALRQAGVTVRSDKGRIDAMAAQIILQSYFDGGDAVVINHGENPA
jgi:putative Holliday junction resolvase